jgi:hypothetical protein
LQGDQATALTADLDVLQDGESRLATDDLVEARQTRFQFGGGQGDFGIHIFPLGCWLK